MSFPASTYVVFTLTLSTASSTSKGAKVGHATGTAHSTGKSAHVRHTAGTTHATELGEVNVAQATTLLLAVKATKVVGVVILTSLILLVLIDPLDAVSVKIQPGQCQ